MNRFLKNIFNDKIFLVCFIFILIINILKIFLISITTLIDDEAHYVLWTHHLPFGFFDHGPGIAFFIKISTLLFGNTEFGVRFGSILFSIVISFILFSFIKNEKDENTAFISVCLFNIIPFFSGLSLIVTIDTPMFYFLILTIIFYYKAIFYNKKYFYLGALFFALSLLSKEGAIFIGASIYIFILLSSKRKDILLSKEFYISILLIPIIYSPFIIYNFQTDFSFVKFALDRQLQKPGGLMRTIEFWISQLALFSPIFFILFCYLNFRYFLYKKRLEKDLYFVLLSFIPFIYILQKSFKNKLEANWALFMYSGALFFVSFFIGKYWNKKSMKSLFFINSILSFIMIVIVIFQYFIPLIPINGDPTDRYFKFNSLKYDLKDFYENGMDKNIRMVALNYQIPSIINFYLKPEKEAVCLNFGTYHPTVFDFWYDDNEFKGDNMYFITTSENHIFLNKYFDSYEYVTNFTSYRKYRKLNGDLKTRKLDTYYLLLCKNYKGNGLEYIYKGKNFKF